MACTEVGDRKVNAVDAEGPRCRGIAWVVVDEHGFVRRDAVAFQQDAKMRGSGLIMPSSPDTTMPSNQDRNSKRARAAERSRPTSW